MITTAFLIAAEVLFVIEAVRSKSILAAGLACATAAFLVPMLH